MSNNPPASLEQCEYYIRSLERDTYRAVSWWKPNQCGYTSNLLEAGKYSYEQAKQICSRKDSDDRDLDVAYPTFMVEAVAECVVNMDDLLRGEGKPTLAFYRGSFHQNPSNDTY